jgi:hypothetical protein
MKAKTKKEMAAQKKAEREYWRRERWNVPQLDTPLGRVELAISGPDRVQARCAGWMNHFKRLIPHDIGIDLTRNADGSWQPRETYRARRHREIARTVADAVTAWEAADMAGSNDVLRRATALHDGLSPLWMGPGMACERVADSLSADIESGLFDFDDAGHARAVATKAAERLRQMMAEVGALNDELRQAIKPSTETKAAA